MIKIALYKRFKVDKTKINMPYSKSKITVRSCAILIVEIICTNIRLIKASMIPVNASIPTPLNTSHSQVPGGVIDPFYDINSIENKRKTILRYANNMLDASIQKYGENTTHINNSTEQPEKDLKEKKQIEDDELEYKSITRKFKLNFKNIIGVLLDNYITQNWLGIGQLYWTNSYQSIIESEYFENLIQKYTINNNKKNETIVSSESTNKTVSIEKIVNVPILSVRVHEYYPFVKEDFKNIIKTHYKIKSPNQQMDPFEEHAITEEELAEMFLEVNKSPGVYTQYDFGNILMYKSYKEIIKIVVDVSTEETIIKTLPDLRDSMAAVQRELTKFISGMFNEIGQYIKGLPKFSITEKYIDIVYAHGSFSLDLKMNSGSTSKLPIVQLKNIWKFTNKCFIRQLSGVFNFIKNVSAIRTPGNLKYLKVYLRDYKKRYAIKKKQYFPQIDSIIKDKETEITNVNASSDGINELNGMFKDLKSLATRTMHLLDLIAVNFKDSLEELEAYSVLTNKSSSVYPLQKNRSKFRRTFNSIENYVEYIWKTAKYANEHIGLTEEEKLLEMDSYNNALVKKLSILPEITYTPSPTATDKVLPAMNTTEKVLPVLNTTEKVPLVINTTEKVLPVINTTDKVLPAMNTTEKSQLTTTTEKTLISTNTNKTTTTTTTPAHSSTTSTTTTEKAISAPSYTNKAGQMAANTLLAVSTAGTYILKKIFFFR